MAVPTFQSFMRPLLEILSDGQDRASGELAGELAGRLSLSTADQAVRLGSGETVLANRVGWALTYLAKAGVIERPSRGLVRITQRGRTLLQQTGEIRTPTLDQFPEFRTWRTQPRTSMAVAQGTLVELVEAEEVDPRSLTPQETIEAAVERNGQVVREELLGRLKRASPSDFERISLKLLSGMGYAGAKGDARVLGGPGDGGLDGVIHEDALGLYPVYIQAKRYDEASVGPAVVNQFLGALDRSKASKGVLITTSTFTKKAIDAAKEGSRQIVLVDGERMAALMLEHGIGVTPTETYTLHRVDSDFFEPE